MTKPSSSTCKFSRFFCRKFSAKTHRGNCALFKMSLTSLRSTHFSLQYMSQCRIKGKKRGACLCICSPLGRSLLPGFNSSKQCPPHLPKAWIICLQRSSDLHSLSNSSLCLLQLFSVYKAPVVHVCAHQCGSMA